MVRNGTFDPVEAGGFYLYDSPLRAIHDDETDARALYLGDAGDLIEDGIDSAHDVDGDGWADLIVGAPFRGGEGELGKVGILSDPPDGDQDLWFVAASTIQGSDSQGWLGEWVSGGDLDGDGQDDLFASNAPVLGPGKLRGFQGPIAPGAHYAIGNEWTVVGEEDYERVGTSAAVGDFDGDGIADLAVGARGNPVFSDTDGRVLLFAGPVEPGEYTESQADVVVTSQQPAGTGDFFGYAMYPAQLDADGISDLVISAPYDLDVDGHPAGSVQVLFGAPDLFP
jgi:hypothetical protein